MKWIRRKNPDSLSVIHLNLKTYVTYRLHRLVKMYSRIQCERHYGSITFLESRDAWESLMKLAKNIDHTYICTNNSTVSKINTKNMIIYQRTLRLICCPI